MLNKSVLEWITDPTPIQKMLAKSAKDRGEGDHLEEFVKNRRCSRRKAKFFARLPERLAELELRKKTKWGQSPDSYSPIDIWLHAEEKKEEAKLKIYEKISKELEKAKAADLIYGRDEIGRTLEELKKEMEKAMLNEERFNYEAAQAALKLTLEHLDAEGKSLGTKLDEAKKLYEFLTGVSHHFNEYDEDE